MPRIARDSRLESRSARTKLKQRHAPYWKQIHPGLSIGYRKGPRGGVWQVRKRDEDGRYTFNIVGTADDHADANGKDILDYTQAHHKALKISNAKARGGPYTVGEAARDYLAAKANTKSVYSSQKTIEAHILPHFENREIGKITSTEIENWHKQLVSAPIRRRSIHGAKLVKTDKDPETIRKRQASANRILTVLKALLNRAWEKGKIADNSEWRKVKPFEKVNEARKVFLQPDECQRLINVSQGAFREYVQALLYTGARPGKEIEFIKVQDFDKHAGTLRVPDGKTGSREVFLTDEGVQFFSRLSAGRKPGEYLLLKDDGTQWGKSHHTRPMKKAVELAKLPEDTTAYSLRHTYISLALKNGMNIKVLADSTGTSIRMIEQHYAKFLHGDRRAMFNNALPSMGFEADNVEVKA